MASAIKKKTAVLFAYNGSKFNGSQIQNAHANVRTVEKELENGLFLARCISEDNHGFLNKVKWSRASRTDKGVHALCAVVGMKMLWEHRPVEDIIGDINLNLPEDIRVISLKLVSNHFNAKNSASFREYQYLFPLSALKCESSTEMIEKINEIAKYFHGTHSFHNYSKDVMPDKPESKRYIIKFEVESQTVQVDGCFYLKFVVTGQSFLYHQIRKMIGMTLLVFLEKMTVDDIRKSFEPPEFQTPLAPAEGLSLNRVHFTVYNKKNNHRPITVDKEDEVKINEFYNACILPTIHSSFNVFIQWLENEGKVE
jgi:tRNA pseudouridine38-40 synthase